MRTRGLREVYVFFFNDTATTEIYTLSLHDALPISAYNVLVEGPTQALENDVVLSMKQGNVAAPSRVVRDERIERYFKHHGHRTAVSQRALQAHADPWLGYRSEEHTSELQSRQYLVCRFLLEKKNEAAYKH